MCVTRDGRGEIQAMKKASILSVVSLLFVTAGGCVGAEKSSNPLSPSVAGPIPGVNITPPTPLEPRDGVGIAVDEQPLTLLLQNAETNGERPLRYVFEVATDTGFTNKVFTREGIAPGDGGRTALRLPDPLASGRTYYWRAQALDGANTGPPSPVAHFRIFTPIVIERPTLESPVNNVQIASLQPEFEIGNAPRSGPVGSVNYVLELSDSESFGNKIAVWRFAEQSGQTRFEAPHDLVSDQQFFWHVRAFETNTNASGPWSDTEVFRTPASTPSRGPPAVHLTRTSRSASCSVAAASTTALCRGARPSASCVGLRPTSMPQGFPKGPLESSGRPAATTAAATRATSFVRARRCGTY